MIATNNTQNKTEIIFVKSYISVTDDMAPVIINMSDAGVILDADNGVIEITNGESKGVIIRDVPVEFYGIKKHEVVS